MFQSGKSSSIIELLRTGAEYLEARGVDQARAEADILLAHILQVPRDKLYLERELAVAAADQERYARLLERRGNREPLAYLLKRREFMGLEFYVDPRVLIPRPETELIAEMVLEMIPERAQETDSEMVPKTVSETVPEMIPEIDRQNNSKSKIRILDLCTGSGALAVSIAYYRPQAEIVATDLSADALQVAALNAGRMKVKVDFRQGDLFRPVEHEKFDIIVANPPYVSETEYAACSPEVKCEPSLALLAGEDGLDFYRRIAAEVEEYLNPGGRLLLEIGCSQGPQVAAILREQGFQAGVIPDYAGLDRIVQAKKESR